MLSGTSGQVPEVVNKKQEYRCHSKKQAYCEVDSYNKTAENSRGKISFEDVINSQFNRLVLLLLLNISNL